MTDGARVEVNFPGLSMGIFSGSLRFTSYRGSNLFRMEAIAKTDEPSVAYKYEGGLQGFSTALTPRVSWRDRGGDPQQYEFGGLKNDARVTVKAKNRVLVAGGGKSGSIAAFPRHTCSSSPAKSTPTSDTSGIARTRKASSAWASGRPKAKRCQQYVENFALHNAPPGTWQRMAVYYLITPDTAEATRQAVMAYTHGDVFKPIPGYKTMVNHFHLRFTNGCVRRGRSTTRSKISWSCARPASTSSASATSTAICARTIRVSGRFEDQRDYYVAVQKASDKDFLVTNWEEPTAYFGGHYNIMFPKNVYWSKVRQAGQPFTETCPDYGKVYHTGSTTDVQRCSTPRTATGSMRTRARRGRRAIPTRSSTRRG